MRIYLKHFLFIIPVIIFLSSAKIKEVNLTPVRNVLPTNASVLTSTPTCSPTITLAPKPSPTQTPIKSGQAPTVTPIRVSNKLFDNWFTSYSNQFSVNRNQLMSIAVCESKLNPNAKNGDYAGLFQFASQTWKMTRKNMNLDPNPDLRFDPEESIKTAAFKISTGGLYAWKNCVK